MITIFNLFRTGTPVGIATNGIPGWMPYGNGKFPGSKDGKGIDGLDLKDTILKWYEYPGIFTDMAGNIRKNSANAAAEKPEFTIGPANGDCVPVPDYPQLGSTAALVLGLDSVTGKNIVRTINAVNALIGKPLITKEVINYNKKSTDNFAERYKMAQVVGVGAMIYAAVAGATEAAVMKAALEEQTVKFGDTFGKMGEYVKNPGIKVDWSQYAEDGYERLAQRGMSKELVESIVKEGKALSQNGGAKFAYVTKEGVVVISKEGKLITAWSNSYFDDAMKEIIKSLFGK